MYHAVRTLTRQDNAVFLTDSAVGTQEENNLRHLVNNLGRDVPHERVVPFLTSKHSLEFCLSYAEQAWQHGFPALVVLGGDRTVGRARCVEHAWELRRADPRARAAAGARRLGQSVRRRRRSRRTTLPTISFTAEFYLTQVVNHLDIAPVARFVDETAPARPRPSPRGLRRLLLPQRQPQDTRAPLRQFLPVPVEALAAEFAGRRDARRYLRAHAARDDGPRRPAFLHQQPAAVARLVHAQRDSRTRRRARVIPSRIPVCTAPGHEKPSLNQGPSHPSNAHSLPVCVSYGRMGIRTRRRN